jgi:nucleoside-diphosphate-sugar epimerase
LSLQERIKHIASLLDWNGDLVILPNKKLPKELDWDINTMQQAIFDTSKIRNHLNYREIIDYNLGLERTIEWELNNPPKGA